WEASTTANMAPAFVDKHAATLTGFGYQSALHRICRDLWFFGWRWSDERRRPIILLWLIVAEYEPSEERCRNEQEKPHGLLFRAEMPPSGNATGDGKIIETRMRHVLGHLAR